MGKELQVIYPNAIIQHEVKGSPTASLALTKGASQLGPMTCQMKAEELEKFEIKYGYKPTRVKFALDALAVLLTRITPLKVSVYSRSIQFSLVLIGGLLINSWGVFD